MIHRGGDRGACSPPYNLEVTQILTVILFGGEGLGEEASSPAQRFQRRSSPERQMRQSRYERRDSARSGVESINGGESYRSEATSTNGSALKKRPTSPAQRFSKRIGRVEEIYPYERSNQDSARSGVESNNGGESYRSEATSTNGSALKKRPVSPAQLYHRHALKEEQEEEEEEEVVPNAKKIASTNPCIAGACRRALYMSPH